jgi:Flp pilus assembly pilin Flp
MSEPTIHSAHPVTSRRGRLLFDARGAVLLEYSILVGTVALACAVGLLIVGIAVLNSFGFVRELLLSAIP